MSGGLWLIFRYFMRPVGEWGPEPHPLEPWWLRLHGVFVFAALMTFGALIALHLGRAWASGRRRVSGLLLATWLGTMGLTGYLLLYATDDGLGGLVSPIHWIAGLALPAIYLIHRLFRARRD